MRYYKFFIIIFVLIQQSICYSGVNNRIIITGKIKSPEVVNEILLVNQQISIKDYCKSSIIDSVKGKNIKNFKLSFYTNKINKVKIIFSPMNYACKVLTKPGDSIFINYNCLNEDIKTDFQGDNSLSNDYLNNYLYKRFTDRVYDSVLKTEDYESFKKEFKRCKNNKLKEFKNFFVQTDPHPLLTENFNSTLDIIYFLETIKFKSKFVDDKEKLKRLKKFINNVISKIIKKQNRYSTSFMFRFLIRKCNEFLIRLWAAENNYNLKNLDKELLQRQTYKLIKSNYQGVSRDLAIYSLFNKLLKDYKTNKLLIEEIIQDLKNLNMNIQFHEIILSKYHKIKNLYTNGKAPNFRLKSINGNYYELGQFKNKIIYLHFWATWCRPCIEQIELYNRLCSEFENKEDEIVFISVALERNNSRRLENFLAKKNLKGIKLYTINAGLSEVAKDYGVSSIPRSMIINKDGFIVDANANNHKNPVLIKKINNLIDK